MDPNELSDQRLLEKARSMLMLLLGAGSGFHYSQTVGSDNGLIKFYEWCVNPLNNKSEILDVARELERRGKGNLPIVQTLIDLQGLTHDVLSHLSLDEQLFLRHASGRADKLFHGKARVDFVLFDSRFKTMRPMSFSREDFLSRVRAANTTVQELTDRIEKSPAWLAYLSAAKRGHDLLEQ